MIRERIKEHIKESGLTQIEICEKLGVGYSTLNTFLNGKKGMWINHVQQLLDIVGLSAEGECHPSKSQSMRKAIWVEMHYKQYPMQIVAKDLDISYSSLSGFVNGTGCMSVERVENVMKYLGIGLVSKTAS